MKLSIKFEDDPLNGDQQRQIMTAKVPTTIFNQPFISGVESTTTTTSPSDFSFSLSTNFPSGPSLKLSYTPTASTNTTTHFPLSLSLKSGLGFSGSPRNSPLVFSASFSLSPSYVPVPTFFLHLKPQLGHFSLVRTVFSDPITGRVSGSTSGSREPEVKSEGGNGLGDGNSWSGWKELRLEPCGSNNEGSNFIHVNNSEGKSNRTVGSASERSLIARNGKRSGFSSGISVMARTTMPVTKGLSMNLRWGLNFPENIGFKMPSLTVNKIGLEWVTEDKKIMQSTDACGKDLELLKGTYLSMQRELESVEEENREMKKTLDEMKRRVSAARNHCEEGDGVGKKVSQRSDESSSEFGRWRSKKNVKEEKGHKEPTKSQSLASDLESELQKAIKSASS